MAAPTLSVRQQQNSTLKGQKQSKKSLRSVLTSPYTFSWPALQKDGLVKILRSLEKTFTDIDLRRPRDKKHMRRRKQKGKNSGGETTVQDKEKSNSEESSRISNLRSQLVFGVNAVMRNLERDAFRLVMVDESTSPTLMTQHILMTAASRSCPVLLINHLARTLVPLLDISSLIAIGFKKLSEGDEHNFDDLVSQMSDHAEKLDIPWLNSPDHTVNNNALGQSGSVRAPKNQTEADPAKELFKEADLSKNQEASTRPNQLPPVDFSRIYVKTVDSELENGKIKPPEIGAARFLRFEASSDEDEPALVKKPKLRSEDRTKGTKRKPRGVTRYETSRIGRMKHNDNRPVKSKKQKK